jgi:Rrf2 family protein
MAVNTRTEYALRALLEMLESTEGAVSAQKISERQVLPKKYIEHLLHSLKSAGLIVSSAGSKGGYVLSRDPDSISLLDVMQAVDDRSLELSCSMDKEFCLGQNCRLSPFFNELADRQRKLFSSYSLSRIEGIFSGEEQ